MLLASLLACLQASATGADAPEAPPAARPVEAPPEPPRPVTLGFVGDVIPHASVRDSAAHHGGGDAQAGWDALLADVAPRVRALDWAVANLETPVTDPATFPEAAKVFDAPDELPRALARAGFDAVTLANNHTWDRGRSGLAATLDHVDAAGLLRAGAGRTCPEAWTPRVVEVGGVKVGWVAVTRVLNAYLNRGEADPCVAWWDEARVHRAVAEARAGGAEVVVVSIHWGVEYTHAPLSWDRAFARRMIAAGVDVVAGHHPHFVQPVERVEVDGRVGWVAYSLGNFLSGQGWTAEGTRYASLDTRDALLLQVEATPDPAGARVTAVRAVPLWIEHGTDHCRRAPGTRARIRPVALADLLAGLDPSRPEVAGCAAAWQARWDRIAPHAGPFLLDERPGGAVAESTP